MAENYDIAIVGGGINGAGIARDAAGRGLKVYLCEKGDLGGATSSASTKLLHGGLRYLEHYEFRLVREALQERERLWSIAPHFVRPMRFVLPYAPGMRPKWLLRLGLFIYDHIGGRKLLPGTSTVDFRRSPIGEGLGSGFATGYEYSDCWVEDNRLVIMNAMAARELGATIETHTRMTLATRDKNGWTLSVSGRGRTRDIRARILVNAAGPWANDVVKLASREPARGKVRLVQGSHIVVPKLYRHDRCFIFQNADGRIIFTIPYEGDYTLIGTTDRDFTGELEGFGASEEEKAYLCAASSRYFERPVRVEEIVWSYSGVRPLYDDGAGAAQQATRDYVLEVNNVDGIGMISVFGGKITTYRRLAESVLGRIVELLPEEEGREIAAQTGWTGRAALPGGDFPIDERGARLADVEKRYPFLGAKRAARMFSYYGTRIDRVLAGARRLEDLGRDFGAGLTERELDYLKREEWAVSAEDVVFRRSKLGLRLSAEQIAAIDDYLAGPRKSMAS
ncbi:glycerol-3-phosphate dehydrogenase [Rhizobium alvei]|uniref:Glycerol-3-phosphate dehydrogenase n=1 Tax=Rhizobium alvei TaxID=1132659 RepID=A0ABT8YT07_9HYPH|nr:glycerol-3-phosphate dehydrogenase [Rhizobium alvei]MDO6966897.1 glycerol-3-phosphate dehydrogenase [Rhizobium alvei]